MPTSYLRATTMDPRNRILLRVTLQERTETPSVDFKRALELVESLIRPPSKAALTFLRTTAGRSKGRGISSFISGWCSLNAVPPQWREIMPHFGVLDHVPLLARADEMIQ